MLWFTEVWSFDIPGAPELWCHVDACASYQSLDENMLLQKESPRYQ